MILVLIALFFSYEIFCADLSSSLKRNQEHCLEDPPSSKKKKVFPSNLPNRVIDILPGIKFRYPKFLENEKEPLTIEAFGNEFWFDAYNFIKSRAKNNEMIAICGGLSYMYTFLAFKDKITPKNVLKYRGSPYRIHIAPKDREAKKFLDALFNKTFNVGMFLAKERDGEDWVGLGPDNVYAASIEQWINSLVEGLKEDVEHSGRFSILEIEKINKFDLYNKHSWGVYAVLDSIGLSSPLSEGQFEAIIREDHPSAIFDIGEVSCSKVSIRIKKWFESE